MRLYRTAKRRFVGTQADARQDGPGWEAVEVGTDKSSLLDFLNANVSVQEFDSPAYQVGRSDAERGMTTNPYGSLDLREEWERGHADAVEHGLAKLSSFASRARPRNGRRA